MAAQTKTQQIHQVHTLLKKRYKAGPHVERMSVFEAIIYGICHEGATHEQANQAMSRFKDEFFDWNEVRVSSLVEIEGVLAGLPDTASRAMAIRRFLRQHFEKTYSFTLESLQKKPLKDAIKSLREYEAARSDFVLATVIQFALGGHAMPVDGPMKRALVRLSIVEPDTDDSSVRSLLERAIPKNRGLEFCELMEKLCHDTCLAEAPVCIKCDLKKICPFGHARLTAKKTPDKSKTKPKAEKPAAAAKAKPVAKPKPAAPSKSTKPSAPSKPAPKATKPVPKKPATKPPAAKSPKSRKGR